jgi:hypothetical protein
MGWKVIRRQLFVVFEKNEDIYKVRFGGKIMYEGHAEYIAELVYKALTYLQASFITLILSIIMMGYYILH